MPLHFKGAYAKCSGTPRGCQELHFKGAYAKCSGTPRGCQANTACGLLQVFLFFYYRIPHHTNALDLRLHDVACLEKFGWFARETDAAGCTGSDDVTRLYC